ncbi:MAG: nitroreductase family deazaflavin-dependent oxidoreductase [Actinobacteria bacterium]|nr:nitroreductase family deazaflavin-dependent oxidoreductase [Actinomycetota bacterium]
MATTTTPTTSTPAGPTARYLAPGWLTRRLMNPVMAGFTRLGLSVRGSRVLHVRGRTSGEWRTVPVNPLTLDGHQYLVAPRGQTQWVRNLRVAGGGRLQLGRRTTPFTATEIDDVDVKAPILQAYLRIWRSEVGTFFAGVDSESIDAIRAVAGQYPVFAIETTG